ncbi:MAG: response regulator [Pseudomonadota bacterium]
MDVSIPNDADTGQTNDNASLHGRTCLLVEDEALVAGYLKALLEDAGMIVIGPYGRLVDAVNAAHHADIEVAILDIAVHGGDVFPAADILVARGVPIVFHTGHGERNTIVHAYPNAVIVHKPAAESELLQELIAITS